MHISPWGRSSALGLGVLTLTLSLNAQELAPVPESVTVRVEQSLNQNLDIPQPPRAVLHMETVGIGGLPPVPVGTSNVPQPNSPESLENQAANGPGAPGDFVFYRRRDMRPSGRTQFHPGEPALVNNRDIWFGTGNTYGSVSADSGMTWSLVNPFSIFSAPDGGVCCDQRVLYDLGSGLTLWYIQYRYSSTTGSGGFRIAWSTSRDNLKNAVWSSGYFNAASFGLANQWLDFPDIAISDDYLYIATNVFNSSSSYTNSLVMRIALADFTNGGGITASYYRRTGGSGPMGGGASYRFTQTYNGVPQSSMYWASHNNTASIRIFRWDDANSARSGDVDRTVASWTSGSGSSPGPDGRDWIGFDDHRIASGYNNGSEGAFIWTSRHNGGSRPQSYIRVCRFDLGTRNITANDDVWSSSLDLAYPAAGLNASGHKAMVFSVGSSTSHVHTDALIVDPYDPNWSGQTFYVMASGSNGAPSNRWGDYHTVVANRIDNRTFMGTGMHMSGGTSTSNTVHYASWFGRDDYTPTWVDLNVSSTGVNGVPITVDETDRNGLKNGSTPFTRSYTPNQGYTLHAPSSRTVGSNTYLFCDWTGTGGTTTSTTYSVSSIGSVADTATANYSLQTIITVNDRDVAGSVAITVGTTDLDGQKNGNTQFTRRYKTADGPFSFTAPSAVGSQPFHRWYVNNIAQPIGQQTISVSPSANAMLIEADYCTHTHGSFTEYGRGCVGGNGRVPHHFSNGHADRGNRILYEVEFAAPNTSCALFFGFSRTSWMGTPLPLCLGFIGADPSCCINAEGFVVLPFTTDGTGRGGKLIQTSSSSAIGLDLYTNTVHVDFGVSAPLKITTSNGLQTTLGGTDCN